MNYEQAIKYLGSTLKFGSVLGLERIEMLVRLLGNPSMQIPCIHVAGTNGKGSVSVMAAYSLAGAGFKTGLYTSPFIHRFSERIRVLDGRKSIDSLKTNENEGEIKDGELVECVRRVKEKADEMIKEGFEHPTEFELVTAAAFLHFQNLECEYIVLETGLGGRLDATNVIESPLKCVITPIGYDHMDRLGNTIREIAGEKAGIIKPDADVIVCDPDDYASREDANIIREVIEDKCRDKGVKSLRYVTSKNIENVKYEIEGHTFTYSSENFSKNELFTPLQGDYQTMNCIVAAECCIDICGYENTYYGISKAIWPARFEILRKEDPTVILDGAHNTQGTKALADTLNRIFPGKNIVFLCGMMKDKDHSGMLSNILLNQSYRIKAVYCTEAGNERTLDAQELGEKVINVLDKRGIKSYNTVEVFSEDNLAAAVGEALTLSSNTESVLVVFGTLYMAGGIRDAVKEFFKTREN